MSSAPPLLTLRQVNADTLPALQELYDSSPSYFIKHSGATARPEQAAIDYQFVLERGDRVLLGLWWERESLVGCFDLRFDHPSPGVVWFGALILSDEIKEERADIERWAVRILEEYLRIGTDSREIRLALLLSDRERVRFWTAMGFTSTPEGLRQPIAGKQQRFVIYSKPIVRAESQS
ncbi:MAG: hypothetical protein J5I90_11360 [Caldilineales bacterium]|nr:hypothetical protein [Caldilineales bacterium]